MKHRFSRAANRAPGIAARKNPRRKVVEPLEPRMLLSGTATSAVSYNQSDILASLPTDATGIFTSAGLEISSAPSAGQFTPDYVVVDTDPQLQANGTLSPFTSSSPSGLTPAKIRQAYGINQITFGSVQGDGSGQTIAIVDAFDDPNALTDLQAFDAHFGLPDPPSFQKVNEYGATSPLPRTDPAGAGNSKGTWELEESLDVQWAHAMAPGADIILVEANSTDDTDLINSAVDYARSAPGVVAVTMSFGGSEDSGETSFDSYFTTPANHGGVTFLASTGDDASPGGYPAYSPNVVAVGGTTLHVDSSGNYVSETGWSKGGGGLSAYESQPPYQTGTVTQSGSRRATPDVSFDADPASGVAVYDSYDYGTTKPWVQVGGTSLSSPCWAGIIAIADQQRSLAGLGSLDGSTETLPDLYLMAASNFHDITSGNNGYSAGAGYDLVTGRGSPIANILIPQLLAAGPSVLTSTPTGLQTTAPTSLKFTFSGPMDTSSFSVADDVDSFTGPGGVDLRSTITGFSWTNNNTTLQINSTGLAEDGNYSISIGPQILSAGGAAMDQNANGTAGEAADQYSATWSYDANPLQVTSTDPANGSVVKVPFSTIDVHFNEPFDPSTVDATDLTTNQGSVTAATIIDPTTVRFTLSGINVQGPLTISLAAGAIEKSSDDFPMLAYAGSFSVDVGTVASFQWGPIASPQVQNVPFTATLTAQDAYGFTATGFNGTVNLTGLADSSSTSMTMAGNVSSTNSNNASDFTFGDTFTPNTNIEVTAVRSYFGTSVSIWTGGGTLLVTQAVNGENATWTETPLSTPLELSAGVTYMITDYSASQTYYWRSTAPADPSFAALGPSYYAQGNAFPTTDAINTDWFLVDLRANIPTSAPISIVPTTATFVNGVWTGQVTVTQPGAGASLHADDGNSHIGDSGNFDVLPAPPAAPDLLAASDTGISDSDNITRLNNADADSALEFDVDNTLPGAIVTIFADGVAIGSVTATGTSTIVTTDGTTVLSDGAHSITSRQTIDGLESSDSQLLSVVIDTTPPLISVNSLATSNPSPAFSGTVSDPSAAITMTINGQNYPADNIGDGNWTLAANSISPVLAAPANYPISVTATDLAGNVSQTTGTISLSAPPLVLRAALGQTPGQQITFQFSADVSASLNAGDIQLTSILGGPATTVQSVDYDPATNTATFTLLSPLPAGIYQAVLSQSGVYDSSDTHPAADYGFTFLYLPANSSLALPESGQTYTVQQINIAMPATLDIGNDTVLARYTDGNDPLASIASLIQSGYATGKWTGDGINSSAAANDSTHSTGVGYFDTGSEIQISRATYGDANLSSTIDADDFSLMVLGQSAGGIRWQDGNFNYDNKINADDWLLMAFGASFSQQQSSPAQIKAVALPAVRPSSTASVLTPPAPKFSSLLSESYNNQNILA